MRKSLGAILRLLFFENAKCGPIQIIILPRLERPEERYQPEKSKKQSAGYQECKSGHTIDLFEFAPLPSLSRRAFPITTTDDEDMAIAAISGLTKPSTAVGTAIIL